MQMLSQLLKVCSSMACVNGTKSTLSQIILTFTGHIVVEVVIDQFLHREIRGTGLDLVYLQTL